MEYQNQIKEAVFYKRPNRFLAEVELDGKRELVHVKNTGRCRELLQEGARVFLEESGNANRKTKHSLIAVYKGDMLVNMDSQAPNAVAAEALAEGKIREIGEVTFAKREVKFGGSRFDVYYEAGERKGFLEVKGVTLEEDGVSRRSHRERRETFIGTGGSGRKGLRKRCAVSGADERCFCFSPS